MSTATAQPQAPPAHKGGGATPENPYAPANIADHEADKARREKERAALRPGGRRVIHAETAAEIEAQKPKYRFSIKATLEAQNERGIVELQTYESASIIAQHENDAWAQFCDKHKIRHSPHSCERDIKNLGQL